jgi:hypothetical protein
MTGAGTRISPLAAGLHQATPMTSLRRLALALFVFAGACTTMDYVPASDGGARDMDHKAVIEDGGDSDALPATGRALFEACTENSQCTSMLCTQMSYDRLTHPVCTYACDPTAPSSPQCPDGCNMKGYCKM